jgi:hypothetical protein
MSESAWIVVAQWEIGRDTYYGPWMFYADALAYKKAKIDQAHHLQTAWIDILQPLTSIKSEYQLI